MPRINVDGESPQQSGTEILSRRCTIVYDGERLSPAITQRVEYTHKGGESSVTSVCGETENRRESDQQPKLTVEGIIPESQIRPLKDVQYADEVDLITDVHRGTVYVKRVTIEQSSDVVTINARRTDGIELAFSFQIQFGQPDGGA